MGAVIVPGIVPASERAGRRDAQGVACAAKLPTICSKGVV